MCLQFQLRAHAKLIVPRGSSCGLQKVEIIIPFQFFFSLRKYQFFWKSNKYFSENLPSDFECNFFRTIPYSIIVQKYGHDVLFFCCLEKEGFIKMRSMNHKSRRFDTIYPSIILNNVYPDDVLSPADVIMDTVDPFNNKRAVQSLSDHCNWLYYYITIWYRTPLATIL